MKIVTIAICIFCLNYSNVLGQDIETRGDELISWPYYTEKAKYIYGEDSLINFLKHYVKYPIVAIDSNFNSRTILKFEIDSADNLGNVKAVFCNIKGFGFEAEAIKVLMSTKGCWQSALRDSQKVNSLYRITVKSRPENTIESKDTIYNVWEVDVNPQILGHDSVQAYIASELEWPNQFGLVCGSYILSSSFVVDEFGYVSDISINSNVNVPFELVNTSKHFIIKTNGKWQPAQINNRRVKCKVTLPLIFEH